MANAEQLARLKQGVEAWNEWRSAHQDERIDLRGANLREADLGMARLLEADLWGANLRGAKLLEANLTHATLVKTDLERATLTGCRIYGISAWDVRLDGATPAAHPASSSARGFGLGIIGNKFLSTVAFSKSHRTKTSIK